MKSRCVALLVAVAAALVAALPAAAKEGVKATLQTPVPLDAKPGSKLTVTWTLAFTENGKQHFFGAGGVFVRLLSATGAKTETADAPGYSNPFTATVTVPEGGIGDVRIGLHGFTTFGPSDEIFPITNDPVPGFRHAYWTPTSSTSTWLLVVIAGAAFALCAAGAVAMTRRKPAAAPVA